MSPRRELERARDILLSGGGGAITAALITEMGTIPVGLSASAITLGILAIAKVKEKRRAKLHIIETPKKINLQRIFQELDADEDYVIAIYISNRKFSVSLIGHKDPQMALKLKRQRIILSIDEVLERSDDGDIKLFSF